MMTKEKSGSTRESAQALISNLIIAGSDGSVKLTRAAVFHPISEPPEAAGTYNVLSDDGYIDHFDYTVEGGWNTFFDYRDGEIFREHALDAEAHGFVAWADRIEVE